eukprot:gene25147-biopygen4480
MMKRTLFGGSHQLLARALQPPVRHDTATEAADKAARLSSNMGGVEGGRRDMNRFFLRRQKTVHMLIPCGPRTPAKKILRARCSDVLKGGEGVRSSRPPHHPVQEPCGGGQFLGKKTT